MKVLDADQAAQLLETAKGDRLEALYVVAITGGLRQGEILGLQWQDVDFTGGSVMVQRKLQYLGGTVRTGPTKTDKGRRRVELPEMAMVALRQHRKRMMAEGHGAAWVFCEPSGEPILRHNLLRQSFAPLLKRAKVPAVRFHDLRHTSASLLFAQGVHPKVVQERLGHAQIGVTMDTYSHMLPGMQREAACKFDDIFASAAGKAQKPRKRATKG